jgi:hypothetical protein
LATDITLGSSLSIALHIKCYPPLEKAMMDKIKTFSGPFCCLTRQLCLRLLVAELKLISLRYEELNMGERLEKVGLESVGLTLPRHIPSDILKK